MGRAENRRAAKADKKARTATYNVTMEQINIMVKNKIKDEIDKAKAEATEDAINVAMTLTLAIPLEVLMKYYWPKSYEKKLPEFTKHILDYYERWQNGELDIEQLREDVWTYGGVRFEEE